MTEYVDIALLTLLAITGLGIVRLKNLFAVVLMSGIYSLLSAGLFVVLDAHDVAFTEAAVGVGISTVLFLGALVLVGHEELPQQRSRALPLVVVVLTGGILVYGILDVPAFGDPANPVHQHVAPRYLVDQREEIGIQNAVTAVLASYRGYDTFGETAVIFAAGVGVVLLLAGGVGRRGRGPERRE
jgi:multicomponent Na+:H+ antiporter subunit B